MRRRRGHAELAPADRALIGAIEDATGGWRPAVGMLAFGAVEDDGQEDFRAVVRCAVDRPTYEYGVIALTDRVLSSSLGLVFDEMAVVASAISGGHD